ncbi:MAG: hypothetical protein HXK67_01350 [Clostridiales bacterium]|nr:hypothetical protein [Clostridiales bacterium]
MNQNTKKIIFIIFVFILLSININILRIHILRKSLRETNLKIEQYIKEKTSTTLDDTKIKSKYIDGIEEFYKVNQVAVSKDELQRTLYNFTNSTIKDMLTKLKGKKTDEIKEIYKKEKQSDINIYSDEIYIKIWNQIKQSEMKETSEISSSILSYNKILKQSDYIEVPYEIILTKNRRLYFLIQIPIKDNASISINDYDVIVETLKRIYVGAALPKGLAEKITNFTQSIKTIEEALDRKSNNKRLEYYDNNKESMLNMGINNEEDFQKILKKIYSISWSNNVTVTDITISKQNENQNSKDYQELTLFISTSSNKTMKFTLKLSMTEAIQPNVIISAE